MTDRQLGVVGADKIRRLAPVSYTHLDVYKRQVLARHAITVLTALDAAEEEVAAIAGLRAGRVRLMAFPSSSASLVPRALALLKQRYPCLLDTSRCV